MAIAIVVGLYRDWGAQAYVVFHALAGVFPAPQNDRYSSRRRYKSLIPESTNTRGVKSKTFC